MSSDSSSRYKLVTDDHNPHIIDTQRNQYVFWIPVSGFGLHRDSAALAKRVTEFLNATNAEAADTDHTPA